MSQLHSPGSDGGPDWAVIGGILAAVATIATAVVAGAKGIFRRGGSRESEREKTALANSALTLEGVFRLINELQEETKRLRATLADAETRYSAQIVDCETKVDRLLVRIGELETTLRARPGQVA